MKLKALMASIMLALAGVSARAPQTSTPPLPSEPEVVPAPSEIELQKAAPTVIDWTPRQVHKCPYLHGLRLAPNQDGLPAILDRTGQAVTMTFNNFRNVSCDEKIVSDANGLVDLRARWGNLPSQTHVSRQFHYIIVRRFLGELPAFAEYRTDLKGKAIRLISDKDLRGFPLLTVDFTSTFLFLSPQDQLADRYRYLGIQTIRSRECRVVAFAQVAGNICRPAHFYLKDGDHVLLLQGIAWVDAQTFQILRVMTFLVGPRKDIGLDRQTTTVNFYPVQPLGMENVLWLPRDVRVETVYQGIKIRNSHQYSNFKFFRVESTIKP
jgi:hypothetical protein